MVKTANRVAIVIPYYHHDLTEMEQISWLQALKILNRYQIIAVVPDDMSISDYPQEIGIKYEVVPAAWLKSVKTYNQMMVEIDFYNRFLEYEYILIYQLDAFVFRDELQYFCELGYDYIGAPWINGAKYLKDLKRGAWYVGNGGLSLRNVSASLNILSHCNTQNISVQEDLFWAGCNSSSFKVAPIEIALSFAFERDVRCCYEKNACKIPFGCHAWEKHDFAFWKPLIEEYGYNITTNIIGDLDVVGPAPDTRYLNLDNQSICGSYKDFFRQNNKRIYIWGAGQLGEECGWLLMKAGVNSFEYIDMNSDKLKNTLWNRMIYSPEILRNQEISEVFVIIAMGKGAGDIISSLVEWGYTINESIFIFTEWRNKLRVLGAEADAEINSLCFL